MPGMTRLCSTRLMTASRIATAPTAHVCVHDLLGEGLSRGPHHAERLIRDNALRRAMPRRRSLPKDDGERALIMPNVLDRQFAAARPDQKWVPFYLSIDG